MAGKFDEVKTGRGAQQNGKGVLHDMGRGDRKYTPQSPLTEMEAKYRAEKLKTQGRKGAKAVRINMAFTPANYALITGMAAASATNLTHALNKILEEYRHEHPDALEKANKKRMAQVRKTLREAEALEALEAEEEAEYLEEEEAESDE